MHPLFFFLGGVVGDCIEGGGGGIFVFTIILDLL